MNITRQMIAAVLVCAGGELAAKTLTVDANGGAEFTSIDAAVAVAEPGDTVRVMPGEPVCHHHLNRIRRRGQERALRD